ncbi:hypothetical protein L914_18490 [Phytophthora nicotianae]|uniref:Temptin Cys/Cys disulfide domain-containing protein n=2 Tax=Phytophthora nicotianae TaxID=4792 RepID=W2MDM4_PHYNI|nr:hypothetical protein L914_18490 [Phytophthora nicotianae]ETO63054.1 hypothetical protein F444_19202 [Phytophthora nicotianae P1976]
MKSHVLVAAIVLTATATMDSTMGMPQFLQELPNGSLFQQALGHPGDDSSQQTDFAQAFDNAGQSWTKSLCEAKFSGSSMTNGQAFGDPCCTWKKGGKPDFTVTPFTTTPGKATTCASNGAPSPASNASKGSSGGDSNATKGWTPMPASDAVKSNTGGSTPSPSARCTGKKKLRE